MTLEETLCDLYKQEAKVYAQAVAAAEGLLTAEANDPLLLLARIGNLLDRVKQLEDQSAATRERWRQDGGAPGPILRASLDHIAALIGKLQAILDGALGAAKRQKAILAPRLDEIVRQEQGRRAYGAARPD